MRKYSKTLLGDVNKHFVFKSLLTATSNVLPLHLKQTFLPIIWIFTEGDGIESRIPFKIFSTLPSRFWGKEKTWKCGKCWGFFILYWQLAKWDYVIIVIRNFYNQHICFARRSLILLSQNVFGFLRSESIIFLAIL